MIQYKVCCACGENKSVDHYHKRPDRPIGVKPNCKDCSNKSRKRQYDREKESGVLKNKLWKRVGINISIEEYKVKYDALEGKCEICQCQFDVLCVDHKHTDGALRGLLCTSCNLALANFKDSETNMKNAIKYLEKYGVDYE